MIGFGFGGVLALHMAAGDERVAGVACLGTPADLAPLAGDPERLLERCRQTGVVSSPGLPGVGRRLGQGALGAAPGRGRRVCSGAGRC